MLTFIDLCSGIGGGRLGLEKAGMKCIGYSDTSKLSNTTYNILFDNTKHSFINNVKKMNELNTPPFNVLIAGFPCQSFSIIGRKKGFADLRGQIIFDLNRIINFSQPEFFILENVKGLVTHNNGESLKIIINLLQSSGYIVNTKIISTKDFGIPQNRQRIYFVGIRKDIYKKPFTWPLELPVSNITNYFRYEKEITDENLFYFKQYLENEINRGKYTLNDILMMNNTILDTRMNDLRIYKDKMPTLRSQRDGIYYVYNNKIYQLTGYEALLFQGFPEEYAIKVKDVVSDRHLLMQAGNAMSVNVIEAIGKSIISYMEEANMNDKTMNWQEFEIESTNYLGKEFSNMATFTHEGNSDSTVPDIKVIDNKGESYYIEAKHCPAQCGQFVLIPNVQKKEFDYSAKNVNPITDNAKSIICHMNNSFERFKEAGTAGEEIIFDNCESIFAAWIIEQYKRKKVRFVITNSFKILRIDDFAQAFNISAIYRVKRSGSSSVGKTNITTVKNYIIHNYKITKCYSDDDKLYIESDANLHDKRFIIGKYEYMISKRDSIYEIRKLSNTFNANVIFSIEEKAGFLGLTDDEFIAEL